MNNVPAIASVVVDPLDDNTVAELNDLVFNRIGIGERDSGRRHEQKDRRKPQRGK